MQGCRCELKLCWLENLQYPLGYGFIHGVATHPHAGFTETVAQLHVAFIGGVVACGTFVANSEPMTAPAA